MTNGDEGAIWTTENEINSEINRNSGSRISSPSEKRHQQEVITKNLINNNIDKVNETNYVAVQSRFRRKYYPKSLIFGLIFIILLLTFALWMVSRGRHQNNLCQSKECLRAASNLLQSMDFNVNPCDDFYRFTCGNWAEDHPRPDTVNSFDWFSEKQAKIYRFIRKYLQSNGTEDDPKAVNMSRVMYEACMDTSQMDSLGLQPVIDYLEMFHLPDYPSILDKDVNSNKTTDENFDWIESIALIKKYFGMDVIIGFDIFPDPTNRTSNRIVLGTPEMTALLPFKTEYDRKLRNLIRKRINGYETMDIFVSSDSETDMDESSAGKKDTNSETVKAYGLYITEVISAFVFRSNPSVHLDTVLPAIKISATNIIKTTKYLLKLEDDAENSTDTNSANVLEGLINVNLTVFQNMTDRTIAPRTLPIWNQYLSTLFDNITDPPIDYASHLVLTTQADVNYLENLMSYILELTPKELELYIWWTIVEEIVLHTTSDIRKLHNEYAKTVTNLEGVTPRSLYCTSGVNQLMGMAVSYAIAKPNFLAETKPRVQTMINNIRYAFDGIVKQINWMDYGTKCSTLEKSSAMRSLIGFPDWILEPGKLNDFYKDLKFNETTHLNNMMQVLQWKMADKLRALNETEELEWATTPTNVNAFHTFQSNAITVPLAILQYPFYDLGLEALNYGAIGTILGHELTHGFDDSGRMFDKTGNLRQWWTNQTISEYVNRTQCFIKQYNSYYIPEVDDYIDGELTLGENIADNGGLREAFYAYKLYTQTNGKEMKLPGLEKYTHEQLLFISFGNLWCETQTTIATKWALEDSHCPGNIRLRGVLENSEEFSQTFNCPANSAMNPRNRCRIW